MEKSPIDNLSKEATKLLGQIDEVRQKVRYIISRAHLVPLGEDRRAGMVFDSETMSYSLGWTNDQSLKASGMPFAGAHGAAAVVKESYNLFRTNIRPGWAKTKEMINKDPHRQPYKSFPRMGKHHGSVIKVSPDGEKLSIYASGFRAPNGMGVGPNGEVTTGDNEGSFVPSAPLHWVKPDSFNGVVDSYHGKRKLKSSPILGYEIEYKNRFMHPKADAREGFQHDPNEAPKPLVWMSKKRGIDNSGGGQAWVTSNKWGPLKDQLLHLSYGQSKMYVVLKEEKNGQVQGGVARIPVELSSSAVRARINPRDGQLYASGLKGWQTNAKGNGGLDRIRYTGKPVHLPNSIQVKKDRIEIGFYEALEPKAANSLSQFKFGAWNIKWSFNYGSQETPVKELELKKV